MFYTRNNPPPAEYSVVDKKLAPVFGEVVNKHTGRKEVKALSETNFYQRMQEQLQETLIYNVIDRYNKGDTSLIGDNVGGFIDTIGLPTTLQEIEQSVINAEMLFKALPIEKRREYGHDVGAFLSDVQNQHIAEKQKRSDELRKQAQMQGTVQTQVETPKEVTPNAQ